MSKSGRKKEAKWLQISKEKLLHDVSQKKLTLIEAWRVIMNSTFSEDVQNDLSLAVCKAAGSVNGFNQAISQIVFTMYEQFLYSSMQILSVSIS